MADTQRHINIAGSFVAAGLVSILGFVTWALVFRTLPAENQNALTLLIGVLSANVGMVVGFYFGSSADNKKLAETVNVQAKTAATAGAALSTADSLTIPPDEPVTVTPTASGETVISKSEDRL